MRDRELVTSDEFWKERVWRELNRLNMADATSGHFSRPRTAQTDEERHRLNRLYGSAGTEMSQRFQCNRRFAEAGAVINATQMVRNSMTPRRQTVRSVGAPSSRGSGSNMSDYNDSVNLGGYFEPGVPGPLQNKTVNDGQHELEVPFQPSHNREVKSPVSDTASLTSFVGSRPASRSTSHRSASARHNNVSRPPSSRLSYY